MGAQHVLTILAVADLDESARFYRRAFEFEATVETPVYIELADPDGQRLGLYERTAFAANVGGRVPTAGQPGDLLPTELYFFVDDLDAAIDRLARAGGKPLAARSLRPWGDEAAYFADPSGNVVVVARPPAP